MNWRDHKNNPLFNTSDSTGRSFFSTPDPFFIGQKETRQIISESIYLEKHFRVLQDDRTAVVVGALLVENSIERFLTASVPNLKVIKENKDFTFSLKIDVARSLNICSNRVFTQADLVRKIRNEFAHDLKVDQFRKIKKPAKLLNSFRDYEKWINPKRLPKKRRDRDSLIFQELVSHICITLLIYSLHFKWVKDYVKTKAFRTHLKKYCKSRGCETPAKFRRRTGIGKIVDEILR
jgi:hypothetical protein